MAAIARRSIRSPISRKFELAAADDLNGVQDLTKTVNVTGAARVIIIQENDGTAGTTGIDVVAVSHDGGENWTADDTLLAADSDDSTGTLLDGILNAAGVEPTHLAAFKSGPYQGPTLLRVVRNATELAASAAWTTGAPSVDCYIVGGPTGTPAAAG